MDEVAAACGVGKGTLYRYFPSKRDLYLAVTFDGIEQLQADLEAIGRVFFALIHGGEGDDPGALEWVRRRVALARVVERAIAQGTDAGTIRPVDARLATEMLFGMLRGANRYRSDTDSLDDLVALVVDVFLHGVGV
jgi:AcrR family transcriptional regulator